MTDIQQNRCLKCWKWSRGLYIDMWDMAMIKSSLLSIQILENWMHLQKHLLYSWKSSSSWYDTSPPLYVHILMMTLIWNKTNNKNLLINTMWIGTDNEISTPTIHPRRISWPCSITIKRICFVIPSSFIVKSVVNVKIFQTIQSGLT
jgi:hypothetical protein